MGVLGCPKKSKFSCNLLTFKKKVHFTHHSWKKTPTKLLFSNCCNSLVYSKRQRKFMSFSSIIYTFFKVSPLILGRLFWLLLGQHLRNPRKSGGRCSHTSGLETGKMAGTLSSWNLTVTGKKKNFTVKIGWKRFGEGFLRRENVKDLYLKRTIMEVAATYGFQVEAVFDLKQKKSAEIQPQTDLRNKSTKCSFPAFATIKVHGPAPYSV